MSSTDHSGDDGSDTSESRTIEVGMLDNEFTPASVDVEKGETVKFAFDNQGDVAHDAIVGDEAAQVEHEEEMAESDGMSHGGDGDAVTVEPGDDGELVYTFDEAGALEVGCHQPGHYASGMKISVTVS